MEEPGAVVVISRLVFIMLLLIHGTTCWDTEELELFDIVEEVNANFYELLGVDQSASGAEIRRAYRKLSVKLHPDKNKEEGAEEQFRKLVAVYEVLKDEQRRLRYNEILVNGLPDWRMPVYYYRRVRKLGLLELSVLLLLISTVGHFLVIWSMYFEKRFEREAVFKSRKKKDKKGKKIRNQMEGDVIDEALQEELDAIPRPKSTDLVPCKIVFGFVTMVTSIPVWVQEARDWWEERKRLKQMAEEEESEEEEQEKVKKPRKRVRVELPEYNESMITESPVVYLAEPQQQVEEEKTSDRSGQEWTDEEISLLAKACTKFPSGTVQRWDKIAAMVNRSVPEVTAKSKEIKNTVTMSVDLASQGVTGSMDEAICFKKGKVLTSDISKRSTWNGVENDKEKVLENTRLSKSCKTTQEVEASNVDASQSKRKSTSKGAELEPRLEKEYIVKPRTERDDECVVWTQNQQKALEWALSQYPRGTVDRWDKIAEQITGKTKEDCIARFKHLAEQVKRKKELAAAATKQ